MSQPYDQDYELPALREIDREKGEFWVSNPFQFSGTRENLSAYERNGVHLNAGNGRFFDISFLSGADSPGDGRTVIATDLTGDGMPELVVRQVGGGPLLVYRNDFPKTSWLRISLRGTKSNRLGIGSKIEARVGDRWIRRELYPVINFHAQAPSLVELGLGEAERIDELRILWPSGEEQLLEGVAVNRRILIDEEEGLVDR